jgi:hypothetical protein
MAAMEPVDGSATSVFGLLAEVPCERPDQPRRDGLEDGAGERPLAADRDHDTAFAEPVFDRKIARQVATSGPACDATGEEVGRFGCRGIEALIAPGSSLHRGQRH